MPNEEVGSAAASLTSSFGKPEADSDREEIYVLPRPGSVAD
jgi:hypothetical protein